MASSTNESHKKTPFFNRVLFKGKFPFTKRTKKTTENPNVSPMDPDTSRDETETDYGNVDMVCY